MKIQGWECSISSADQSVRGATHPDNGTAVFINGRLMGNCDMPREVFLWLVRPLLREIWEEGSHDFGMDALCGIPRSNPYLGEPPNKDQEPS